MSQSVRLVEMDGRSLIVLPIGVIGLDEVPQAFDGDMLDRHTRLIPQLLRIFKTQCEGKIGPCDMLPINRYFLAMKAMAWVVSSHGGSFWLHKGEKMPVSLRVLRFCLTDQVEVPLAPSPDRIEACEEASAMYESMTSHEGLTDLGRAIISDWFINAIELYLSRKQEESCPA